MSAPTEAEIYEAIASRFRTYDGIEDKLDEALDKAFDALAYIALDDESDPGAGMAVRSGLWGDLRPSEALRLRDLTHDARGRLKADLWGRILETVATAGMTFAAEHPDAPRANQPVTA